MVFWFCFHLSLSSSASVFHVLTFCFYLNMAFYLSDLFFLITSTECVFFFLFLILYSLVLLFDFIQFYILFVITGRSNRIKNIFSDDPIPVACSSTQKHLSYISENIDEKTTAPNVSKLSFLVETHGSLK